VYSHTCSDGLLITVQALSPEKMLSGFMEFVTLYMGAEFVQSSATRLDDVYNDTDPTTPIIFSLSPGMLALPQQSPCYTQD